ncbi:TonB-dependent siderophore receptor [Sphingomonas sp. MA1305]|uniref:TonB-dependent siderophore receptor n=1 Tax=Sphingomonas sp. MA1305 TaxID=2479204 RepID=UPI0018E04D11|nr:TonB-dependent receptor [Sphingomonas sp. MA1305]
MTALPLVTMAPASGWAQGGPEVRSVNLAAMPLDRALEAIATETGQSIGFDRAALTGLVSRPVREARSVRDAVGQAIAGLPVSLAVGDDGGVIVTSEIVVSARRDEAETQVLVRQTSTSDRTGQALRDQPRNTEVISARLIEQQQDVSVSEALRNAGGVVSIAPGRGGSSFTVRGFTAEAMANGLPGASAVGAQAGTPASLAAVERIEVLKGPVAILAGSENLGGTINIVSKKPSAERLIRLQGDIGSYRLGRTLLDANGRLTDDGRLSARLIASASAQRNAAGYRGSGDYLILPELRFKDAATDILFSVQAQRTAIGVPPFAIVNPQTNSLYDVPRDRPLFHGDQGSEVKEGRIFLSGDHRFGAHLSIAGRYQHQDSSAVLASPSLTGIIDPKGVARASNGESRLTGARDAIDGFARVRFGTIGLRHQLVLGHMRSWGNNASYTASRSSWNLRYAFLDAPAVVPIAVADTLSYRGTNLHTALYAQDLAEAGPLHLLVAVRRSTYASHGLSSPSGRYRDSHKTALTPSYGAVVDVTREVSVFVNSMKGFSPTTSRDFNGDELPNIETRNAEAGIKLDLLHRGLLVNASYFDLFQSNIMIPDPLHRGYAISGPGQIGRGIDVNASGTLARGLTAQATFTEAHYTFADTRYGPIVPAAPATQFSLFGAYERRVTGDTTVGVATGLYGRSRAAVDRFGRFSVPPSLQMDLNMIVRRGPVDLNLGIRNLFDRRNFGASYGTMFIPYGEARNWRLSAGYRFG